MIARTSAPPHDRATATAREVDRRCFHAVPRAWRLVLLAPALVACAGPGTQQAKEDRPVDLRRSGSVATSSGAAVPLALCARSAALARALDLPPGVLRLPAVCSAAGRL
jgi:hypothetical protein